MKGSRAVKNQIKKEMDGVSSNSSEQIEKGLEDALGKMLKEGMTPKDAFGVSSNVLESVYAQAYRLYNTGKFVEAIHLFRILILMNTTEPKYTLGLAACFHMLKEYKNAIQAYTMCTVIDPVSPIPHYHASDCFIQMKDSLSAMISLQMAIDKAEGKAEYTKIKERALLTLESLKQQPQLTTPEFTEESM